MAKFDPERMATYRLARRHTRAVHAMIKKAKARGFSGLVNQLRDSTTSIPANLLEAIGEWRPGKRLNYLMIAKGSTCESWAHTDSMIDFELVEQCDIVEVRGIQVQLIALLITSVRNLEVDIAREEGTRSEDENQS